MKNCLRYSRLKTRLNFRKYNELFPMAVCLHISDTLIGLRNLCNIDYVIFEQPLRIEIINFCHNIASESFSSSNFTTQGGSALTEKSLHTNTRFVLFLSLLMEHMSIKGLLQQNLHFYGSNWLSLDFYTQYINEVKIFTLLKSVKLKNSRSLRCWIQQREE